MRTDTQHATAVVLAVAEAIEGLGRVPSGHLYAQLMGHMSLETYEKIIGVLIGAKMVRKETSHELVWIGPSRKVQA